MQLAIQAMSWRELQVLAMRLTDLPIADPAFAALDGAATTEPPRTVD